MPEFATERTEIVITALNAEGKPGTPAVSMAKTKGEALLFAPEAPRSLSSSEGKIKAYDKE